jgi:uncharacterized protein
MTATPNIAPANGFAVAELWAVGHHKDTGTMTKNYLKHSWIDSRIEIRPSLMHGLGSFARSAITAGEVVTIWGGEVFTLAEVAAGKTKPCSVAAIAETLVLASPVQGPDHPDQFLNHSCDPNVWMQDEVTLIARYDIRPGEELTADYTLWEWDEQRVLSWQCRCGAPLCRGRITGRDWRRPELQARYQGHFSPFINARIAQGQAAAPNKGMEPTR